MHRELLAKHHPETYRRLRESQELTAHAEAVGELAMARFETISSEMANLETPAGYRSREEYLRTIPVTAEEIVLHQVVKNRAS